MSKTPPRGKRRRTQDPDTEGSGTVGEPGQDVGNTNAKASHPRPKPVSEDVNGNPEPMDDAGELSCSKAIRTKAILTTLSAYREKISSLAQ